MSHDVHCRYERTNKKITSKVCGKCPDQDGCNVQVTKEWEFTCSGDRQWKKK